MKINTNFVFGILPVLKNKKSKDHYMQNFLFKLTIFLPFQTLYFTPYRGMYAEMYIRANKSTRFCVQSINSICKLSKMHSWIMNYLSFTLFSTLVNPYYILAIKKEFIIKENVNFVFTIRKNPTSKDYAKLKL